MSIHEAVVEWRRLAPDFEYATYDRGHWLSFPDDIRMPGAPHEATSRRPRRCRRGVDPEQAFVASLSSCHMLWFLHLRTRRSSSSIATSTAPPVRSAQDAEGKLAMTRVDSSGRRHLSAARNRRRTKSARCTTSAHEKCFIANSVKTG